MSGLVRYEAARGALAAAHSLDEVRDIRDKSEAMAAYARQAHDVELIAWATEIKVRAERRCGEMLRDGVRAKPADTLKRGAKAPSSHDATTGKSGPTLAEIGISKDESSRWQRMAALPEKAFETVVEVAKAQVGQVTSAAVLRAAKAAESPSSHDATTGKKPKTPKKPKKAAPEPTETNPDLESPAELLESQERELATLTELLKAADADDQKAEALKWRRAYDAAVRGQSEAMDRAHKSVEREKATKRSLMRCGKAVGEDDEFKIAAAVEAMARAYKAERKVAA